MSPFDYLNSINDSKVDLMTDQASEKAYNAFIVNRSLSYFPDTILLANEMNSKHHLGQKPQYHFLINTVRKKKRFSKWIKPHESEDLMIVKEYYGYSNEKARVVLTMMSKDQILQLKQRLSTGGQNSTRQRSSSSSTSG